MSGKLSHFIHAAPGNTTQDCLPRERKKVHESWGEEDTWTGGTDVLQLNKGHDYKPLHTHLEKRHQVLDMEKVHMHTHINTHMFTPQINPQ